MTYCVRKINWKRFTPLLKTVRNYAKYEASAFCKDLKELFSADCPNTDGTTEELWNEFKTAFNTIADTHVPYIQRKIRGINSPWINQEIKQAIQQRQYHLRKARKTKSIEDMNAYTSSRNNVTRLIRVTKANYFKRLVDDNCDNPKSFWKIIKSILPGEQNEVQPTIKVDGCVIHDKIKIANAFNKYIVEVVSNMLKNLNWLHKTTTDYLTYITTSDILFEFTPINEEFTLAYLKKMKTGKAVGLDGIPARLLKDSAEIICKPLTKIVNSSLATGIVPTDWKTARVIPVSKNARTEDLNNYRPISVLPLVSKVLERAVHSELYTFFTNNHLLNPHQHGFRKGHSTETATICFTDEVRRSIDQGLLTGSIFIDLSKAFDSVNHDILLHKLHAYGVRNGELEWFRNYLSNRVQQVCFQNTLSNAEGITSGVPQGSILGPLLFVIFINDLPKALPSSKLLLYADDAVIFNSAKDVREIEKSLSNSLNQVQSWLRNNCLFLNQSKTECILFGTGSKLSNANDFNIEINGESLKRVFKFKYLGVVLDECLSWKEHLKYILTKAGRRVGRLKRLRKNITKHVSNTVYKSFILPIFDYCDTVWSCCNKTDSVVLEKLQRRAARVVMKSAASDEAMANLRWQLLSNRRDDHTLKLVKKSLRNHCPMYFRDYFTFNHRIMTRTTRQSNLLHLPRVKLECTKRSFFYNGCVVYNNYFNHINHTM